MPPVVKSGKRYNATVQMPSMEDYQNLKVLAAHMGVPIGKAIVELTQEKAKAMGIDLRSPKPQEGK